MCVRRVLVVASLLGWFVPVRYLAAKRELWWDAAEVQVCCWE